MPRNVLMTRLEVPGFGGISVYNTHLCASCPIAEREVQLAELLGFVDEVESSLLDAGPVVLGGDFNIDIFRDDEAQRPMYDTIVQSGFIDAYAAWVDDPLEKLCEPPARQPDEHCTVGVAELNGSNARRIDYIFTRNFGRAFDGGVLFNTLINADEPTVSDHAGVFASVELPELLW
jgi:maltose 6'-phosphate phosphatase